MIEVSTLREYKLGKSFQFQLSSGDGRYSTTYSVVTRKSTDDVYIIPMMMGGEMKVSLHKTGSWQAGLTEEGHAKFGKTGSRHWEIFKRPDEFGVGATRAWYLVIPHEELRVDSNEMAFKIPPVGPGYAASIEFVFLTEQGPPIDFGEVAWIGQWRLKVSGERLVLFSRKIPWSAEERARAILAKAEAVSMAVRNGVTPTAEHAYFFHGQNDLGVRFGMELAAS
ncbi:MAG: hypothetical protein WDO74_04660 [Pseudomonadota bacterium]